MLSETGRSVFIFTEAGPSCPEAHAPHLSSVEIRGRPLSPALEKSSFWTRFLQCPRGCGPSRLLPSPSKACLSIRLPSGRFSHLNLHHARLGLALHISHFIYSGHKDAGTSRRFSPVCAGDPHRQHSDGSQAGRAPALSSRADSSTQAQVPPSALGAPLTLQAELPAEPPGWPPQDEPSPPGPL